MAISQRILSLFVVIALTAPTTLHSFLLPSSSSSSKPISIGRKQQPFLYLGSKRKNYFRRSSLLHLANDGKTTTDSDSKNDNDQQQPQTPSTKKKKNIVIIGGGWAGLSTAHHLIQSSHNSNLNVTLIDASPRVGGLVNDSYKTRTSSRRAEAGQHGFWDNYHNIFHLLRHDLRNVLDIDDVLTGYAEQGQYSPNGLEATWPVYRDQSPQLPTGLAQALYTKFNNLPVLDRLTAAPLILAFSEFDDSPEAWAKYDSISFRELCIKLGVSRRCYDEAFEPMILTGLFAPGGECSAAAALGMAYFFVLRGQNAFDVRWCRGNVGERILEPWVGFLEAKGVGFLCGTKVIGLEDEGGDGTIRKVLCSSVGGDGETVALEADDVVFAVGATALNAIVRNTPLLSRYPQYRKFANLRGTSVLATRIYLDQTIDTAFSANACWGFDKGIGMTVFDITKLHSVDGLGGNNGKDVVSSLVGVEGSVMEVDYYACDALNVMDDQSILTKVKNDLDTIYGPSCINAKVTDAAIIRLPQAVNWYFPGSYTSMPDVHSSKTSDGIPNLYFAGDIVRSRHGSWSQEKAFVTGMEAANIILGMDVGKDVKQLNEEEAHVVLARNLLEGAQSFLGGGDKARGPSIVDFFW